MAITYQDVDRMPDEATEGFAHQISRDARAATSSSRWCRRSCWPAGADSQLSEANRQRLAAVDTPVTMQVFTTPT